jgi:hypothetical protein
MKQTKIVTPAAGELSLDATEAAAAGRLEAPELRTLEDLELAWVGGGDLIPCW